MRGLLLASFSVLSIFVFSMCLFISDNLLMLWLFLELGALSLVPLFFFYGGANVLSGLFSYIIISGVSSSLMVSGMLYEGVMMLVMMGFIMKFGIFPFAGWVYSVFLNSGWLVIWALSSVLKISFLFISFFYSGGYYTSFTLKFCCFLSFLFLSLLIWLFTFNWVYYWCHVTMSSSASFLVMSSNISLDLLLPLFIFYIFWVTLIIYYFSYCEGVGEVSSKGIFLMVFLLVSFPGSLSLFYKLVLGSCIFSVNFAVFLSWVVYNISEQLFLVKLLMSIKMVRSEWCGNYYV